MKNLFITCDRREFFTHWKKRGRRKKLIKKLWQKSIAPEKFKTKEAWYKNASWKRKHVQEDNQDGIYVWVKKQKLFEDADSVKASKSLAPESQQLTDKDAKMHLSQKNTVGNSLLSSSALGSKGIKALEGNSEDDVDDAEDEEDDDDEEEASTDSDSSDKKKKKNKKKKKKKKKGSSQSSSDEDTSSSAAGSSSESEKGEKKNQEKGAQAAATKKNEKNKTKRPVFPLEKLPNEIGCPIDLWDVQSAFEKVANKKMEDFEIKTTDGQTNISDEFLKVVEPWKTE